MNGNLNSQTPCPCCGSVVIDTISKLDGKTGDDLHTVVCMTCGLGRIDPLPTPEDLEAWYRDSYRQDYKASAKPAMRHVLRAARNMRDRWNWLKQNCSVPVLGDPVLDVGASSGEFVYLAKHLGYKAIGIEPHTGYGEYAREQLHLDIRHGSLRQLIQELPSSHFSLVTMFHVLEHFVDPAQALAMYRRVLRQDGMLYIEVPGSTRLCGKNTLFFRAHTLHFTAHSLRALLEHSGFEIVSLDAPWDGNISALAKIASSPAAPAQWTYDDSMRVAAAQRTAWRYALRQLVTLEALQKLWKNFHERRFARKYVSSTQCLDAVYSEVK
ncbi:MAG: class I SAM-dependent methyltransferase [Burkholderiales bacterium]|nr:MAG: class I SAM-dependent methyltransferase [Burkholderiales bacterium]